MHRRRLLLSAPDIRSSGQLFIVEVILQTSCPPYDDADQTIGNLAMFNDIAAQRKAFRSPWHLPDACCAAIIRSQLLCGSPDLGTLAGLKCHMRPVHVDLAIAIRRQPRFDKRAVLPCDIDRYAAARTQSVHCAVAPG